MKHERKRNRMSGYDYSRDNLYFITSIIHNRMRLFGEVIQGQMNLSKFGNIARTQWLWLEKQYPYVQMHEFVIMPDHMHGIIEINRAHALTGSGESVTNTNKIKSLSELMGAYKTTVSKQIHLQGRLDFAWQRSFHDHIIRNESSYYRIARYIENNPANWVG